jgi:hypothetical protein
MRTCNDERTYREGEIGDLLGLTISGVTFDGADGMTLIMRGGAKLVLPGVTRSWTQVLLPIEVPR